jgi:hypothetical protein
MGLGVERIVPNALLDTALGKRIGINWLQLWVGLFRLWITL